MLTDTFELNGSSI